MECPLCRGRLARGAVPFTLDRKGFHVALDAVPAWVCSQCGEPTFESDVVAAMQRAVKAFEREVAPIASTP